MLSHCKLNQIHLHCLLRTTRQQNDVKVKETGRVIKTARAERVVVRRDCSRLFVWLL